MKKIAALIQQIKHDKPSYNDLITPIPTLIEDNKLARLKNLVEPALIYIEPESDDIFVQIKNCKNINEANVYFDILEQTQDFLATLFFNDKISLSPKLENFVIKYERLDDPWLREFIFTNLRDRSDN